MNPEERLFPPGSFAPAPPPAQGGERLARPALSFWREAALRLRKDPVALFCMGLLLAFILGALLLPLFSPFNYAQQNVAFANRPFLSPDPATGQMHWFGTDHLGRDIFVRVWYGARISLTVALAVALIDCFVGILYGGFAGYTGGGADTLLMRILEVVSGIPYLLVVLLLMAVLPRGMLTLIVAYSLTGWTGMARLVRAQVLSLKEQEFMIAAKIMGAGAPRAIFRHLAPNMMGVILVNLTLDIPGVIFTESFLSLLGMGIAPPYPSLGVMAGEGMAVFQNHPSQMAVPAVFICLIMLAFNLLGDHLQEALDPKLRRPLRFAKKRAEN